MLEGSKMFFIQLRANGASTSLVFGSNGALPLPKAALRNCGVPDDQFPSPKSVTSKTKKIRIVFSTEATFTSNSIFFPYREGTRAICGSAFHFLVSATMR